MVPAFACLAPTKYWMQSLTTGTGRITEFVGNDDYPLQLKIGQLRVLQQELGDGPSKVLNRLQSGEWFVDDIIVPIRLGLIGGGMSDRDAKKLVDAYIVDGALIQYQVVAIKVMFAAISGNPEDMPDMGETMAPTMTGEDWFDGEHSSLSPEPLDTPQETLTT